MTRVGRLRLAVRVLSALLAVTVLVLAGTIIVNRLFSEGLARAYKKPLHVVESQLQLNDVGKVVIDREFDNSGLKPLGLGGANMQANITITGADVQDRLSARLRSLRYQFRGTTGNDGTGRIRPTENWELGDCKVRVIARSHGVDLVLLVSSE